MLSQRFTILLEAYLSEKISHAEMKEFSSMLDDATIEADMQELIGEELYNNVYDDGIELPNTEARIQSYLQGQIQLQRSILPEFSKKTNNTRWWWVAAAVLFIVAGSIYYSQQKKEISPEIVKQLTNDVLPGGDRAVLTLPSGKKIILDSTQGQIIASGDLKVLNENGKLDYEGSTTIAEMHTLSTPKGGQYKITLPDGTEVWLNAASSIEYPTAFTSTTRTVTITGEAYFEVAKDPSKPFEVVVDDRQKITVTGTHFNVNAYPDESSLNTTLLEGAVNVQTLSNSQVTTLRPGQQSKLVNRTIKTTNVNADVIEQVMAWKNGTFNFDGMKLKDAMRQLERWYDIEVKYEGDKIPDIEFYGTLSRDKTLAGVLAALKDAEVHFKIEGKTLTVFP